MLRSLIKGPLTTTRQAERHVSPEMYQAENWALTRGGGEGMNSAVLCRLLHEGEFGYYGLLLRG